MATAALDIRAELDAEIKKASAEKDLVERSAQDKMKQLERQIKTYQRARAVLIEGSTVSEDGRSTRVDPAKRAGPKAIGLVAQYLQKQQKAYQSAMVKDLPLQASVVSYAVHALLMREQIRPTGERYRGSKEYAWVGKRERITNVEPGVGVHSGRKLAANKN